MLQRLSATRPVVGVMLFMSMVSVGFYAAGSIRNASTEYWYLLWNLFLAWIPFLIGLLWYKVAAKYRWDSWQSVLTGILWLGFLPNSFYPITDFVHLAESERVDVLYDVAMMFAIVATSVSLGYLSLYLVHQEMLRIWSARRTNIVIAGILLVCSFAIYLGRNLRWNTWDILLSPAALLFDVSSRILQPFRYPDTFITTATFFILLGSLYIVIRRLAATVPTPPPRR